MSNKTPASRVSQTASQSPTQGGRRRRRHVGENGGSQPLAHLQRTIGNRAMGEMIQMNQLDVIMRSAFDGETPELQSRRINAIGAANIAVSRLQTALSQGYIWSFENVLSESERVSNYLGFEETFAVREARLRQLIRVLLEVIIRLESAPIPPPWLNPEAGNFGAIGRSSPIWQDTVMFYAHRVTEMEDHSDIIIRNVDYIDTDLTPQRRIPPVTFRRGVSTGINIAVPDPENRPQQYQVITPTTSPPGIILEVLHDDFGYYYFYRSRKQYLRERPSIVPSEPQNVEEVNLDELLSEDERP